MSVRRAHSGSRRTFPALRYARARFSCPETGPIRRPESCRPPPGRFPIRTAVSVSLRRSGELHRPGTTAFLFAFSRYVGRRNAVRIFLQDSGKHPDIQIDSLADFAQTDEFVRAVRPRAVAYAQLQRRDVEQGLVRRRGRSVGRAAQRQSGRTIGWAGGMLDGLSRVERGTTSLRTWRRISSSTSSFV